MKKPFIPRTVSRKVLFLFLLSTLVVSGVALAAILRDQPGADRSVGGKHVSFAVLEDYDKGDDLNDIALDFALLNELDIDTMRCSFGWDDYEPVRGQYDFVWLEEFVSLADQYGIKLRPYIGYTPEWAGAPDSDGIYWNNPPGDYQDWYNSSINWLWR